MEASMWRNHEWLHASTCFRTSHQPVTSSHELNHQCHHFLLPTKAPLILTPYHAIPTAEIPKMRDETTQKSYTKVLLFWFLRLSGFPSPKNQLNLPQQKWATLEDVRIRTAELNIHLSWLPLVLSTQPSPLQYALRWSVLLHRSTTNYLEISPGFCSQVLLVGWGCNSMENRQVK